MWCWEGMVGIQESTKIRMCSVGCSGLCFACVWCVCVVLRGSLVCCRCDTGHVYCHRRVLGLGDPWVCGCRSQMIHLGWGSVWCVWGCGCVFCFHGNLWSGASSCSAFPMATLVEFIDSTKLRSMDNLFVQQSMSLKRFWELWVNLHLVHNETAPSTGGPASKIQPVCYNPDCP